MWMTYAWIFVIVMYVKSVDAATVKRPVLSSTNKNKWFLIPNNANTNDTWIPIPYDIVVQETNITELLRQLKIIRMHANGILSNHSIYPTRGKNPPSAPVAMIIYISFMLILSVVGSGLIILEFMQKRRKGQYYPNQHGQTTHFA